MKKREVALIALTLIVIVFTLAACTPSRDACKAKYEQSGYKTVSLSANTLGLSSEEVDYVYSAQKEASSDYIEIVCFKKKDNATLYCEKMQAKYGENGYKVEQKGKVVLVGTENALKIYNNQGGVTEGAPTEGEQS